MVIDPLEKVAKLVGAKVAKVRDWEAFVAALIASKRAVSVVEDEEDEEDEPVDSAAIVAAIAALPGAAVPARALAWHDPYVHAKWAVTAVIRELARALSAERLGLVRLHVADRTRVVVVRVPWADRAELVAAAKQAGGRATALGPTKPGKPLRAAKPPPVHVKRHHLPRTRAAIPNSPGSRLVFPDKGHTYLLDVDTWPPKAVELAPRYSRCVALHPSGDGCAVAYGADPIRVDRIPRRGKPRTLELGADIHLEALGFLGDMLVALPSEPDYRAIPGKPATATGPLACPRGERVFSPLFGLPATRVKPYRGHGTSEFVHHGFARTGAGDDVLLWEGGGYVNGERRFELPAKTPKGDVLQTLPAPGDAFYLVVSYDVVLVRAGAKPVRTPLVGVDGIAAGPDGVVLARPIGKPPRPALLAWWPTTNRVVHVKHAVFGTAPRVRGQPTIFTAHGYAPGSELVWLYDTIGEDVYAVPWRAIETLRDPPTRPVA